jgi:succinate dehydrogenase / fumarate reductase flavoprotein subunit
MQEFDVLVIGGGASGLRAAIATKHAGAKVALITKVHPLRTNSGLAQGGLNAPLGKDDSPENFVEDTLRAGDGLGDREVVRSFAADAAKEVIWLERMGAPLNRNGEGRLDLRPFGSNGKSRTCYADDQTGHIVLQVLHEQFQRAEIASFEEWFVTSLVSDGNSCVGAVALSLRSGKLDSFTARAVILATGGFTRLYLPSTASLGTTGDGQSLAYEVGAQLMDMEMIQFHPTVFPKNQALLITEAAVSEGAVIINQRGESIQAKGLSREKICLSLHNAMQNGGGSVSLDLRPIGKDKLLSRFPQTHELVRGVAGLDITKEPIPIRPAAHRSVGGIKTDAAGETSLPGLFAVGECACNGLNGAGRLAGNALTEALVFGRKVGEAAAKYAKTASKKSFPTAKLPEEEKAIAAISSANSPGGDSSGKIHVDLGKLMNEKVGLIRDQAGLQEALDQIYRLKQRYKTLRVKNASRIYNYELTTYLELGSMLTLAEIVTQAALARTESRGAHHRADFPQKDDHNWRNHTLVSLVQGMPRWDKKPVAG